METIVLSERRMRFLKILLAESVICEVYNPHMPDKTARKLLVSEKDIRHRLKNDNVSVWIALHDELVPKVISDEKLRNAFRDSWKLFRSAFLCIDGIESFREGFEFK